MHNTIGTPIPRGWNQHECQVAKGNYEWDNSCGGEWYPLTVPKCGISKGTIEPDVGTLKENVRGCDWDMQLCTEGVTKC